MQSKNIAYLYTGLTILFWAGAASAFKSALTLISPIELLCASTLLSLLVLSLLLTRSGKLAGLGTLSLRHWLYLLTLGAINPFLYYVILFQAYDLLPGQVAMSLNYLWPVMLAILAVPILHHSLSLISMIAILLSFSGAVIIASGGSFNDWGGLNPAGIALALVSTLVWAVYWLLNARLRIDAEIKLFVGFMAGTALSWGYALGSDQFSFEWTRYPWLSVTYVGIFEMGITFFIWLRALQLAPNAARIGNLIYLTPFLSLSFLALLLGETIQLSTLAGLLVIISGILLQQYAGRRQRIHA